MELWEQRKRAARQLPEAPLLTQGRDLQHWEVVLAYNLQHPLRFRQDYWWLEVLAESALAARAAGWEWVRDQKETRFECTDWIRKRTPHPQKIRLEGDDLPLPIEWDVPLPEGWPPDAPVRHPATGRRLGFVVIDPPPLEIEGEFYLLRHLPASDADLVCLLPRVRSIHKILNLNEEVAGRNADELPAS